MKLRVAAVLPILFCAPVSAVSAGQSKTEIDAAMAKIYAASAGKWKSETHSRSIGRGTDWSTQSGHGSCTSAGAAKMKCEGETGDESWVDNWRVENGVEYLEGKSGDKTFTREFQITHAWFTDKNNYGEERTFAAKGFKDVEYEGIDMLIQMGNRFVALRKVRKKGSGGDYQYSVFHMTSRVE